MTSIVKRIAERVLGPEKARLVWGRLELIGDIAVIKKPPELDIEDMRRLGEALLAELPYVKSVWAAATPVEGEYRLRDFVHLAGEPRSVTVYKEYGCRFKVDIRKVFVTPRLSYEHMRVAKLVKPGETVINMYAGAGLFSILIAKYAEPRVVYSIDINPDAYKFMVENVKLNKVEDRVVPILGDATKVVAERLRGVADRILMPLPDLALQHLPYAIQGLRDGTGVIHVYIHIGVGRGEDPVTKGIETVGKRLEELGVAYRVLGGRIVRMVGPRRYQVVVDVFVEAH